LILTGAGILNIVLNVLLIPVLGLAGAAIATSASFVALALSVSTWPAAASVSPCSRRYPGRHSRVSSPSLLAPTAPEPASRQASAFTVWRRPLFTVRIDHDNRLGIGVLARGVRMDRARLLNSR
jgi:hypothetical protein